MMTQKAQPPWGSWEVLLSEPTYKLKRLIVNPGKRLSYQKHSHRQEHWVIVMGEALVTLNDVSSTLKTGEQIDIPTGALHRIANNGASPMVFIEIQTGSYFGEDDIERVEDDYGRAKESI